MSPLIFHSASVQMNKRPRRHLQDNNEIDGIAPAQKPDFLNVSNEYQQPFLYTITVSTVTYKYVLIIHCSNIFICEYLVKICTIKILWTCFVKKYTILDMNRIINFPLRILDVGTYCWRGRNPFISQFFVCVRVRSGIEKFRLFSALLLFLIYNLIYLRFLARKL